MPPIEESDTHGKAYWRSLDDLAETPEFKEFLHKEFPGGIEAFSSTSRRHFLKVMGASLAMAGLAGCRWPKENILPFANRPDGRTPGVAQHYATTYDLGGVGSGLLVTSYDGRPVKVEGNPGHPQNRGATTAQEQALILEMYDPDRSQWVVRRGENGRKTSTWKAFGEFARSHMNALKTNRGVGLRILSEASSSETLRWVRDRFLVMFPEAKWVEYEALSRDNEREGARLAFGKAHRTLLNLGHARIIAAFDPDFLDAHPAALKHARDFALGRAAVKDRMNRLHVIESTWSLAGGMADHRHIAASGNIPVVVCKVMAELKKQGLEIPGMSAALDRAVRRLGDVSVEAEYAAGLAADLLHHRGTCLVTAGSRQPAEVHALIHLMNAALGNVGKTVDHVAEPDEDRPTHVEAIRALSAEMTVGKVDTLVLLGGNPAFDAPADVDFSENMSRVKTAMHLSLFDNETSVLCDWSLPRAHAFEAWGDARAFDGTHGLTQPLIAPLYGGKTPMELISLLVGEEKTGYDILRETLRRQHDTADFEKIWRRALHDGLVAGSRFERVSPTPSAGALAAGLDRLAGTWKAADFGWYEVVFAGDPKIHDGRFANNGWLQELPEAITKLTWDNAALVSPEAAKRLGLARSGDEVRLVHKGGEVVIPAFIQPGQAPATVTVWLGQGRRHGGRVAGGAGTDTYPLRTTDSMDFALGLQVETTGGFRLLATTQDHHAMDTRVGRRETRKRSGLLIREATLTHYEKHPDFARHVGPHVAEVALWDEHDYSRGYRWGMAIDLNVCTGCSACVAACQAENNLPVVGRDEVARGREMHWLRVDRYYTGDPEAPAMSAQPVPCMQCENAPCEQVCPVAATVHSEEGLNDMVYNRCIGTRYCSNNCPFKVRRFNWFLNHADQTEVEKMRHNPEVSLRARGVMEKCTYCLQRVSAARIKAKNEGRRVKDGEITPACAQVCPTGAITFGDLNDRTSRIATLQTSPRCYGLLSELKVLPRTRYLAKITNPALGGSGEHPEK